MTERPLESNEDSVNNLSELLEKLFEYFKNSDFLAGIFRQMGIENPMSDEETETAIQTGTLPEVLSSSNLQPCSNPNLLNVMQENAENLLVFAANFEGNGNNPAGIAIKKNLDLTKPVKMIYHLHGLSSFDPTYTASNGKRRLNQTLAQLDASDENAILVYPLCGPPNNEAGTYDTNWMRPPEYNFDRFHQEVIGFLEENGINLPAGSTVTAEGHSAGGQALRNIAQSGSGIIDNYVFLDASYGSWANHTYQALQEHGNQASMQIFFIDGDGDNRRRTSIGAREMVGLQNVEVYRMNQSDNFQSVSHGDAIDHFFAGIDPNSPEAQARRVS